MLLFINTFDTFTLKGIPLWEYIIADVIASVCSYPLNSSTVRTWWLVSPTKFFWCVNLNLSCNLSHNVHCGKGYIVHWVGSILIGELSSLEYKQMANYNSPHAILSVCTLCCKWSTVIGKYVDLCLVYCVSFHTCFKTIKYF